MRILVTGAAGQLGTAHRQGFARARRCARLHPRRRSTSPTAGVEAFIARERPEVIINCAAYNDVDGGGERRRRTRSGQRARRAHAGAAPPRPLARCWCTTARTSSSMASDASLRRRGRARAAKRLRLVEAARRVVCGGRAATLRAAGREPVRSRRSGRAAAASGSSSSGRKARGTGAGVRGSHRFAELHAGRRRGDLTPRHGARARPVVSLRQQRAPDLARRRAGGGSDARTSSRAVARGDAGTCR